MNKQRSGFRVMARLVGLVRPLGGYMTLAVLMGLAGHLCAAFLTILGGYGLLAVLGESSVRLTVLFGGMLALAVLRGVLRYAEQGCNHFIAFKLLALLREKVFAALRRLCPAKLDGRDKGDLIALITSDIELLEVFYAHTISPALIALLFSAGMAAFIGSFDRRLGLLAAAAYGVVGLAMPLVAARWSGEEGMRFRTQSGELSAFVLESLRGLPEILQFGQGQARLAEMNRRTDALSQREEKLKQAAGRNTALTNTVVLGFDLAMLFCSAGLYQSGAVSFAGVLIPTLALFSSFGPVIALAALGSTLQNTFAAGNRVLDILEEIPAVQPVEGRPAAGFAGAEAKNVSFSYEGEEVLRDLSLSVPQRAVIGIVGSSGSGRSTLLKLFMRFWQTRQGSVELSGRSVDEINTEDLRRMEGYVTQETHLFRDSIKNNLRIAKLDATDAEIEAACKKASVHEFIQSLPQGYDTPVGELGDTLSGGQRQRLGLARAFLHDAPFLLLDEPTSNLDSLNEAVILRSLQKERAGKTILLVSHRLSTLGAADKIYSVENGRVS